MSKGLEDLKVLKKLASAYAGDRYSQVITEDIERELKAFDIIKNKSVDMSTFGAFETYNDYEHFYNLKFHLIEDEWDKLDEKEFNLLKGILNDEQ